ncbi:HxsD-like protein [Nannocystaceae bacterium ST9]
MSGRELSFPREVYAGEAIDQAVKTWSRFADFTLRETDDRWIVAIAPKPEYQAHARRIIGEFGNAVLGMTIDRGGAS